MDIRRQVLTPFWEEYGGARFQLRPLTRLAMIDVKNHGFRGPNGEYKIDSQGLKDVLRDCLMGWEGVNEIRPDGTKVPLPFSLEAALELPDIVISWLAYVAVGASMLTEDDEKKSSPPQTSSLAVDTNAHNASGDGIATAPTRRGSRSSK